MINLNPVVPEGAEDLESYLIGLGYSPRMSRAVPSALEHLGRTDEGRAYLLRRVFSEEEMRQIRTSWGTPEREIFEVALGERES